MSIFLTLAALSAATSADPAAAQEWGTAPSTTVVYGDLDLTTVEGQKRLQTRIAGAQRALCGIADGRDFQAHAETMSCRSAVALSARPQVEAAIRSATTRMAVGSNSGTDAPRSALSKPVE